MSGMTTGLERIQQVRLEVAACHGRARQSRLALRQAGQHPAWHRPGRPWPGRLPAGYDTGGGPRHDDLVIALRPSGARAERFRYHGQACSEGGGLIRCLDDDNGDDFPGRVSGHNAAGRSFSCCLFRRRNDPGPQSHDASRQACTLGWPNSGYYHALNPQAGGPDHDRPRRGSRRPETPSPGLHLQRQADKNAQGTPVMGAGPNTERPPGVPSVSKIPQSPRSQLHQSDVASYAASRPSLAWNTGKVGSWLFRPGSSRS